MTDPLRALLAAAAAGRPVSRADLDALPAPSDVHAEVLRAVDRVRMLRRIGLYRQSYQLAQITATDLQRHLRPNQEREHVTDDPREQALRGLARDLFAGEPARIVLRADDPPDQETRTAVTNLFSHPADDEPDEKSLIRERPATGLLARPNPTEGDAA